ncbi:MAG: lysylphosphatidylglycerol synthase transmembrane domain-containing protein [Candidatus Aminicenantes bacterium]
MKKNLIRVTVLFFLAFVFLYFFFRSVDWKEVFSYLTDVDLKFFILIVVLVPVHLLTRSFRWRYLLKHEKQGVGIFNRFAANAVGFTVTFIFPGRLGELVRPLYLAQKEKISKGFVLGTVVVERTFDIFTMCFLLGLFLVSKPLYSSFFQVDEEAYSSLYLWGIVGLAFAFLMLITALSLYFFKEKTLSVISFLLKPFSERISEKVLEIFHEFIQGLKFFHSVGNFLMYVLWSFIVWLGIIFYYWIFFFAYNIRIPFFFLFPYVFLTMVGASIPTPGMVGGFHYFSKLGLTSLYHIGVNLAVSMTIVVHAVQVVVTCLVGYAILWKEGISLFQLKKLGEEAEP